jgi:hypothetical protein
MSVIKPKFSDYSRKVKGPLGRILGSRYTAMIVATGLAMGAFFLAKEDQNDKIEDANRIEIIVDGIEYICEPKYNGENKFPYEADSFDTNQSIDYLISE